MGLKGFYIAKYIGDMVMPKTTEETNLYKSLDFAIG
jgi:hypothetical protein